MDVTLSRQETGIAHKMSINAAFHLVGQRSSRRADQALDFTLGVSPPRLHDCIDNATEKAAAPGFGRWCWCVHGIFPSHASAYKKLTNKPEKEFSDDLIALADKTDMSRA